MLSAQCQTVTDDWPIVKSFTDDAVEECQLDGILLRVFLRTTSEGVAQSARINLHTTTTINMHRRRLHGGDRPHGQKVVGRCP